MLKTGELILQADSLNYKSIRIMKNSQAWDPLHPITSIPRKVLKLNIGVGRSKRLVVSIKVCNNNKVQIL